MPVYEENFKVNGQKVYYIRCYVDGPNGRKQIKRHNIKEWIGNVGKKLAQQEEIRLVNKKYNNYEDITVNEIAELFFETKEREWSLSTYKKNTEDYRRHIKNKFGNRKALSITQKEVLEWKNKVGKKHYSINYLSSIYLIFSAIMDYGKYYNIPVNVVKLVGNFKTSRKYKKREMKFINMKQFNDAIKNEKNIYYYVAFHILFYTGIRRGEMLALNVKDLNFEENTIRIDETFNPKISHETDLPKTVRSRRTIPVKKELMDMLKHLISLGVENNGYIFMNKITLTTLKRKSDINLKSIGFTEEEHIRIHDYRHSFISMCINNNVPIEIISDYVGHENTSVTWDIYGHLYPERKNSIMNALNFNINTKPLLANS